jgi:steroid 5-alpha reductase family enzyme
MMVAWKVQDTSRNTGWIDVFWTFGLGTVCVAASVVSLPEDSPFYLRRLCVAGLIGLWSARLGRHILMRTLSAGDDPRYRRWIDEWGIDARRRMFWHLQSQAAVGLIFALAVLLAAHNPHPGLRVQDVLGSVILIGAIIGESIADLQLRQFKAMPEHRNRICDMGLWAWSRHPNYFFEWLCWVSYPLIAVDFSGYNPYAWLALAAPACMYWILIYVSGIPPLEDHMLRSHGEAFRAYRQRTNAFFPWPPSREKL